MILSRSLKSSHNWAFDSMFLTRKAQPAFGYRHDHLMFLFGMLGSSFASYGNVLQITAQALTHSWVAIVHDVDPYTHICYAVSQGELASFGSPSRLRLESSMGPAVVVQRGLGW